MNRFITKMESIQKVTYFRIKLGFIGIGSIVAFVLLLPHFVEINQSDYYTQLAVGMTLLSLAIAYWTFKPQIEKLTEKIREEERAPTRQPPIGVRIYTSLSS